MVVVVPQQLAGAQLVLFQRLPVGVVEVDVRGVVEEERGAGCGVVGEGSGGASGGGGGAQSVTVVGVGLGDGGAGVADEMVGLVVGECGGGPGGRGNAG